MTDDEFLEKTLAPLLSTDEEQWERCSRFTFAAIALCGLARKSISFEQYRDEVYPVAIRLASQVELKMVLVEP